MLSDSENLWRDTRNVIEVSGVSGTNGEFIMNGGAIIAGEQNTFTYKPSPNETQHRLVNGSGIVVNDHATVTINAGHIEGRGEYALGHNSGSNAALTNYARAAAINMCLYSAAESAWGIGSMTSDETTSVFINDCELVAADGAEGIRFRYSDTHSPTLSIRAGTFSRKLNADTFYYRNEAGKRVTPANWITTPTCAFNIDKYKVYCLKTQEYLTKEYCDEFGSVNGDLIVVPKDRYTPSMWERKGNTLKNMLSLGASTVEWNSVDDIVFLTQFGNSSDMNFANGSAWPAPYPDKYPNGVGAPEHNITYIWKIYDTSGQREISEAVINHNDNTFSVKNQVKPINIAKLTEGTIYCVKCEMTETYEGTHSFSVNASSIGFFKVVPYKPYVDVQFRQDMFRDDLVLDLKQYCSPDYLEYQKKRGYIGAYKYIVRNTTDNTTYNVTYEPGDTSITVSAEEMNKHTVGMIDVSVEVVLYKGADYTEQLTTAGEFKKAERIVWLPSVTCYEDNGSYDKDKNNGVVELDNDKTARLVICTGKIAGEEYGITDGINYYKPTSSSAKFVTVNSDMGSGTYFSYVKGMFDGYTAWIFSHNKIVIKFDDPSYTWDTSATKITNRNIKADTVFGSDDKLSATVNITGKTVSDPRILWTVWSSPDNILSSKAKKNRYDAGTTTVLTAGKSFKSEIALGDLVANSLQDFPEGEVVFRCELYDGSYNTASNLVTYVDVKVSFVLMYNEYHLWAERDGKYQDVTNSWMYIGDEESFITVDVKGNPEFTHLGVLDSYVLGGGYEAKEYVNKPTAQIVKLGEKDASGQQVFSHWIRNHGTVTLTLCHPVTEFTVEKVDAPELGKRIDQTKAYVPKGANYTAKLTWYINGESEVTTDTYFRANYVYVAYVTFIPNDGVVVPINPLEGSCYYLDGSVITCYGNFGGLTYLINKTDDPWEGYGWNSYIVKDNMPVSNGTDYFGYCTAYAAFERLIDPDENAEYVNEININYVTPMDGDKKADFKVSIEPFDAIAQADGKQLINMSVTRVRDGSTKFTTFEEGEEFAIFQRKFQKD